MMLSEWQKTAKGGESYIYYTGHLGPDAELSREANAIGQAAYAMYRSGWYELVTKRVCHEPTIFEYLIIRRRRRDEAPRPGIIHDVRYYRTSKPKKDE